MIKLKKDERGMTLIELLATLVITAIIFTFTTSIIVNAMDHYKNIAVENELRDEADLIMTQLYRELYTAKETDIEKLVLEHKISGNLYRNSYIQYKETTLSNGSKAKEKTGFIEGKIFLKDIEYQMHNPKIQLNTDSKKSSITRTSDGIYEINLILYMVEKNKVMEFTTEISTVNDKINEEVSS